MNATGESSQELLSSGDIRFIAEIGLMAAGAGNGKAAESIFQGLLVLRKDRNLPYIGLSLAKQCQRQFDEATRILREDGLRANPDDPEILSFLGLALHNAGRPNESERVMRSVLRLANPDSPAHRMASNFLAELERCGSGMLPKAWLAETSLAESAVALQELGER
jgi:Flp pilus assembly protein TadD